jgi:hypothetical protein
MAHYIVAALIFPSRQLWRAYGVQVKKSVKAALFSGLIFPGLGHMALKQYLRGSILMLPALVSLSVIVTVAARRALAIVDSINSGEIPVEKGAITELVSNSAGSAGNLTMDIALIVIVACWLIGIVDSYRLGKIQEK